MIWHGEAKKYIFDNYKGTGHQAMADKLKQGLNLDVSKEQIKAFYHNNKLNSGITGRFEKGAIPKNKGKKMSKAIYEKCKNTMFISGNIPANHRQVGSERVNVDGYIEIKTAEPNKWRAKHVVAWERANGRVPQDHVIVFADGNKQNYSTENLLTVSHAELLMMNRHRLISENPEVTKTGVVIADIHLAIGKRRRGRKI